jgi:pimeloyl-ACP methyl ester carboxylesterase
MHTVADIVLIVAAAMAIMAAVVVFLDWRARRKYPPIGRFIECDGARLHYIERGPADGEVVVLLHGNGSLINGMLLSGLVDLAAQRYRVICFDRPGFGHSSRPRLRLWTPEAQADLLAAAVKKLGVQSTLVFGHSWGTLVALAMAARQPALVRGLVLASGYYFPTARKDVWFLVGPAIPVIGDILRYTIAPFIARLTIWKLIALLFDPKPIPEKFKRDFPTELTVRPISLRASAEETAFMIPAAARLQQHYPALQCPAVVLAGDGDRLIEIGQAERLQKVLPRAVLRRASGVGHMLHHAEPERVVDSLDLMKAWKDVAPAV